MRFRQIEPIYMNDTRISHRICLSSTSLYYDENGCVCPWYIFLMGIWPPNAVEYVKRYFELCSFLQQHRVTRIVNLFHPTFGLLRSVDYLAPPSYSHIPVDNIATQYVHIDPDTFRLRRRELVSNVHAYVGCVCAYRCSTFVSPNSRILAIVPEVGAHMNQDNHISLWRHTHAYRSDDDTRSLKRGFVLVYMLSPRHRHAVFSVAIQMPDVTFVYFVDDPIAHHPTNVVICIIHPHIFREHLIECSVVWTSGGYMLPLETISVGIPILMTPTQGHLEQYLNCMYFKEHHTLITTCAFGTHEVALLGKMLGRHADRCERAVR